MRTFERFGLSLREIQVDAGNRVRDLMVAGQADGGVFSAPTWIIGAEQGGIVAVGLVALGAKTAGIVARKDAGITTVGDLKGKKIALQVGTSTGNIALNTVLPAAGLQKGDYEVVNISVANMVPALAQRLVDAIQFTEPYGAIAVAKGIGVRLTDYEPYDPTPIFLTIRSEFLEQHRDAVVQFLKALETTARLFEKEPDQAYDIMPDFYKQAGFDVDRAIIKDATSRLRVQTAFPAGLRSYLAETAEWQRSEGQIREIPNWDKLLRSDVLDQAKRELGV